MFLLNVTGETHCCTNRSSESAEPTCTLAQQLYLMFLQNNRPQSNNPDLTENMVRASE